MLEALRERLRCKESWVLDADHYRNSVEDLPSDFDSQRAAYYEALAQPFDVESFIHDLQQQVTLELEELDRTLSKNGKARLLNRRVVGSR